MKRQEGIHFYINIVNFNDIILDEEAKTKKVTHAIHALDTFFSSVESYAKRLYGTTLTVEKITGSRLHLYVVDSIAAAFSVVKAVSVFAYQLSGYINKEISKYKTLLDFRIQVGVAYGRFYDFDFTTREGYSELTTIGHAANYAAKLQALTGSSKISISENVYDCLSAAEQEDYTKITDESIIRYGHECYYTMCLSKLHSPVIIKSDEFDAIKKKVNFVNLDDIEYSGVRKALNYANISKTQIKSMRGIPVFADVRGFTCQFKEDDSNLAEMAQKTQSVLFSMYNTTVQHGGIHIQFQGDRELALYHDIPETEDNNGVRIAEVRCFKQAILGAMRMIDAVKPLTLHIGVGEDYGKLFATKFGARGEKDNILLGATVIQADAMEDKHAEEDQIAITKKVYDGLVEEDKLLADQFKKVGDYFVTTVGYQQFVQKRTFIQQKKNTDQGSYNRAWGDMI